MVNHYELLYLVPANYTDDELVPIKEKVKNLIKKFDGEVTMEDSFGKKKLAYPIDNNHQGYYLLYEFDLDGEKIKNLDQNLKLTNEIMRHIIVKRSLKAQAPQRIMEKKIDSIKIDAPIENKVKKIEDKDKDKGKIKLEDLDQKLDEILEGDIL